MWDYKTKWSYYDLRITISAPPYLQDLSDAIEEFTYRKGEREELLLKIKKYEPEFNHWKTTTELHSYLKNLENGKTD